MSVDTCPTCGGKVRVAGDKSEGTMHYEPIDTVEVAIRAVNMRVNTQAMSREIDGIIRAGGDAGQILNLFSKTITDRK